MFWNALGVIPITWPLEPAPQDVNCVEALRCPLIDRNGHFPGNKKLKIIPGKVPGYIPQTGKV